MTAFAPAPDTELTFPTAGPGSPVWFAGGIDAHESDYAPVSVLRVRQRDDAVFTCAFDRRHFGKAPPEQTGGKGQLWWLRSMLKRGGRPMTLSISGGNFDLANGA